MLTHDPTLTFFLDHNFTYLLEALEYDRNKFPGPPRATDLKDVDTYFGGWANVEVIHREPDSIKSQPDLGAVDLVHYFFTPKN